MRFLFYSGLLCAANYAASALYLGTTPNEQVWQSMEEMKMSQTSTENEFLGKVLSTLRNQDPLKPAPKNCPSPDPQAVKDIVKREA